MQNRPRTRTHSLVETTTALSTSTLGIIFFQLQGIYISLQLFGILLRPSTTCFSKHASSHKELITHLKHVILYKSLQVSFNPHGKTLAKCVVKQDYITLTTYNGFLQTKHRLLISIYRLALPQPICHNDVKD